MNASNQGRIVYEWPLVLSILVHQRHPLSDPRKGTAFSPTAATAALRREHSRGLSTFARLVYRDHPAWLREPPLPSTRERKSRAEVLRGGIQNVMLFLVISEPRPEPPKLDTDAVALAEAELDAAARDRARAEDRAEQASRRLADASQRAATEARSAKNLALRVRDPSTRIRQASARGGFLKAENAKLRVMAVPGDPRSSPK